MTTIGNNVSGFWLGKHMKGGKIVINGEISGKGKDIALGMSGGKIYRNGMLIYKDGVKL